MYVSINKIFINDLFEKNKIKYNNSNKKRTRFINEYMNKI